MVYSPISYTPFCATWFRFTVILLLLVFTEILNAQTSEYKHPATYALVVGISDYQHEGITDLDFADRDAGIFASWLQSPSGGLVPPNHIVFLKNEEATHTAIYHALDWLIDSCKKNDTVYIFFSGHGDVENNDVYKDGFLLTYNTPRQNYLNFSLSVGDLNFYANYLTLQTQAQLILITDACHSGFLAGNAIKGKYLVAEQMRMILNKEIRLNSCTGEQLSNEDKDWGGGRGIFSYYLINGLNGLADQEKDKKISMREIQHYVDSCMHDDPLLKAQRKKQTPVFSGNNDFILAQVDSSALKQIQNESSLQLTAMAVSPPAYAL
ncbi:MAG TPA: caspase family protein, partial [Chitinophagaceae bacterium]|nr:caspase family protein [Chitinophagaceae bacterium]